MMPDGRDQISPRSALVTGASGHLGSALVRLLVREGWNVAVALRNPARAWRLRGMLDRLTVVETDLESVATARSAIVAFQPLVVFHLAWYGVSGPLRNSPEQITKNIGGTLALLEILEDANVRKFIGVGSQAEYGPHDEVISEETRTTPATTYGVAKLACALACGEYCRLRKINFSWLRLFSVYGPQEDLDRLIPSVIAALTQGKSPALSSGTQPWDYLFVDDAAEAMFHIAHHPAATGIMNLASGERLTVRQVAELLREMIAPEAELGFGRMPMTLEQSWGLRADVSKLFSATPWRPRTPIATGLRKTIDWYNASVGQHV